MPEWQGCAEAPRCSGTKIALRKNQSLSVYGDLADSHGQVPGSELRDDDRNGLQRGGMGRPPLPRSHPGLGRRSPLLPQPSSAKASRSAPHAASLPKPALLYSFPKAGWVGSPLFSPCGTVLVFTT